MGIKAVVFDYGNVLSCPQEAGTMGLMASMVDISEEQMASLAWELRADYDRGLMSAVDYYRRGLAAIGKESDEATLTALVRVELESWARLDAAAVALFEELKARGCKAGILSNMPTEFAQLARKRFPVIAKADACVFSCEEKLIKPEPDIYQVLLRKLAVPAEEVVFFDDLEVNVKAACALGIHGEIWTGAAPAKAFLSSLGVL